MDGPVRVTTAAAGTSCEAEAPGQAAHPGALDSEGAGSAPREARRPGTAPRLPALPAGPASPGGVPLEDVRWYLLPARRPCAQTAGSGTQPTPTPPSWQAMGAVSVQPPASGSYTSMELRLDCPS